MRRNTKPVPSSLNTKVIPHELESLKKYSYTNLCILLSTLDCVVVAMRHPNETGELQIYKPKSHSWKLYLIADVVLIVLIIYMLKA